jgi:hypothetical protein
MALYASIVNAAGRFAASRYVSANTPSSSGRKGNVPLGSMRKTGERLPDASEAAP